MTATDCSSPIEVVFDPMPRKVRVAPAPEGVRPIEKEGVCAATRSRLLRSYCWMRSALIATTETGTSCVDS